MAVNGQKLSPFPCVAQITCYHVYVINFSSDGEWTEASTISLHRCTPWCDKLGGGEWTDWQKLAPSLYTDAHPDVISLVVVNGQKLAPSLYTDAHPDVISLVVVNTDVHNKLGCEWTETSTISLHRCTPWCDKLGGGEWTVTQASTISLHGCTLWCDKLGGGEWTWKCHCVVGPWAGQCKGSKLINTHVCMTLLQPSAILCTTSTPRTLTMYTSSPHKKHILKHTHSRMLF